VPIREIRGFDKAKVRVGEDADANTRGRVCSPELQADTVFLIRVYTPVYTDLPVIAIRRKKFVQRPVRDNPSRRACHPPANRVIFLSGQPSMRSVPHPMTARHAIFFAAFLAMTARALLGQTPTMPAISVATGAAVPTAAPASTAGAPPAASSSAASSSATPAKSEQPTGFLGNSVPHFDPATELLTWDGKSWNINNNRIFQARFEKYLNAPEETGTDDRQYQALLQTMADFLAPGVANSQNVKTSFAMLPRASRFEVDAHLCDSIADAVYAAWQALHDSVRLGEANVILEQERKQHEWNIGVASGGSNLAPSSKQADAAARWQADQERQRVAKTAPYTTRLAEVMANIKANQIKRQLTELQARIEFQTLIMQMFLQRRFQHVVIASRFYRSVFDDGDTTMRIGSDFKDIFTRSIGAPPTVAAVDSLANEAIRDAREGVRAYEFLVSKNELESATKRLAESFTVGEYLPELRTLPRDKKRLALDFTQKANQLASSLEVKDYARAEKLIATLETLAKDFDNSKPSAVVATAKTVCGMHLAKARNAALSGDKTTLETELKEAMEIWPTNPALATVSGGIFDSADVQQKALADLDQLLAQHNYRQIYESQIRFLAAVAMFPERQEKLKKALLDMQQIESSIVRSDEIKARGDIVGAWETVERTFQKFPEDNKLNQLRANLTTEAAEFVRALRTAQELEQKGQVGASLAWYLKARKLYPGTEFGKAGIDRLAKQILPEE